MSDTVEIFKKDVGSLFITNEKIESGDTDLARLVVLLRRKCEDDRKTKFKVAETSKGIILSWGPKRKGKKK
jgi:hypothetical protein